VATARHKLKANEKNLTDKEKETAQSLNQSVKRSGESS